MSTINIKIRAFGLDTSNPQVATGKFFLRNSKETRAGCRWLEPGEVVAVPSDEAKMLLKMGAQVIEMTMDEPTRPLVFGSPTEAAMTSVNNAKHPGRADEAKAKMAEIMANQKLERESNPTEVREVVEPNLDAREQAIVEREIELGLREDPDKSELEVKLDKDLEDYEPSNNVSSAAEIKEVREAAKEQQETEKAPRKRTRSRPSKNA